MDKKKYIVSVTLQCEVEAQNSEEAEMNALETLDSALTMEPVSSFMTDVVITEKRE